VSSIVFVYERNEVSTYTRHLIATWSSVKASLYGLGGVVSPHCLIAPIKLCRPIEVMSPNIAVVSPQLQSCVAPT